MGVLFLPVVIGVLSFFDILFTYLYLKKAKRYYYNPEELEMGGLPRLFFKKFGLEVGSILSLVVHFSFWFLFGVLLVVSNKVTILYFVVGMLFMVAVYNCMSYAQDDEIRKRLKKRKMLKKTNIESFLLSGYVRFVFLIWVVIFLIVYSIIMNRYYNKLDRIYEICNPQTIRFQSCEEIASVTKYCSIANRTLAELNCSWVLNNGS